jgi:hypothetical protein
MDVRDGFIVGIFNYCDRWCDACALTSRCRVFADVARAEASRDPNLQNVVDAPPIERAEPVPRWLAELLKEERDHEKDDEESAEVQALLRVRELSPEQRAIETRALEYASSVHDWLDAHDAHGVPDARDPRAVIDWLHYVIPSKIYRALHGLANDQPEERDWPADHDGSAKVALLAIERSHAAWLQIVEQTAAREPNIRPLIAHLVWLGDALEQTFPHARAFVRPGFDEPDEVARLIASDKGL